MIGSKSAPPIGSGAKLYEKLLALLMAVALCVGLMPAVAFADEGDETITVALTIIDSDGTVVKNEAYEMPAGSKVKDLLDRSDVGYDVNGYQYAYFLEKDSVEVSPDNWVWWNSFIDGVPDGDGSTCVTADLRPNGHYQFVHGPYGTTFSYSDERSPFEVQLTIVDSDGTVVKNEAYEMPAGSKVKDLLDRSDVGYDVNGYQYAYFLEKDSVEVSPDNWVWWNSFIDGVPDGDGSTCVTADLRPNGHYQFVHGPYGTTFSYGIGDSDIKQLVPDAINNPWPTYGEGSSSDSGQSNPYDADKTDKLMSNLAVRFSAGESDAAIDNDTFRAALALNTIGRGSLIDSEAILKNLESDSSMPAGRLAKYIMALENAGIDCSAAKISGVQKDLYEEMASRMSGGEGINDLVCILPVYGYCADNASEDQVDALVSAVVSAQSEGLWDKNTQTTAQAVLALLPYRDLEGVQDAINAAIDAVIALQQDDGGFAYEPGGTSNLDATAEIIAMLAALDYDLNGEKLTTENGSTPVGYLVALADPDLKGYDSARSDGNEPMAAATVLMALVANNGGKGCNVYIVEDVPSASQPGNTLAQSGDGMMACAGAAGVLALGAICTLVATRRKMVVAQDACDIVLK